jgi:hypothetical protein
VTFVVIEYGHERAEPPDAAANQPLNVYPARVGSVGFDTLPAGCVTADTADPSWLSNVSVYEVGVGRLNRDI